MRLESLSLVNFGGFDQIDIDFEPDVTLISGINGIGKSTLLHALSVVLSRAMPNFTPSRSAPMYFTDDDIHCGKPSLEVSARIQIDEQTIFVGIQRIRAAEDQSDQFTLLRHDKPTVKTSITAKILSSRTLTGELEAGTQETREALAALKSSPNPPLAIFFSPKRQLPGQPRSLPEIKPFDTSIAYGHALHDRAVELREFMHWFRTQEKLGTQSEPQRLKVLDALRNVVTELIPEFTGLRINEHPRLGFIVNKNGHPFFLHQLSDGERGLLALVFDLTRRLAIANPNSQDPITEGTALVMIDEIELHLHPKWQRDILERLGSIFTNCQFIVTTHSPLVLGEAQARSIRFLEYEDEKIIPITPAEAYGMDANRILQNLMETPMRNKKINAELRKLFIAIDQDQFGKARDMIADLQLQLGKNEPELIRAKSLITFLEGSK